MVRRTSAEAYRIIKENGMLSKRRWEVYDALYHNGPLTGGQIGRIMAGYRSAVSTADRNIHARLTELRDRRVAYEVNDNTPCPVTGISVILWDVTDELPRKIIKDNNVPTKRELIEALCQQLELILPKVQAQTEAGKQWSLRTLEIISQCRGHRKQKQKGSA